MSFSSKKILISGASGMLGRALKNTLYQKGYKELFSISKNNSSKDLKEKLFQQEYLAFFHCGAEVNIELCESNKSHAYESNVLYTDFLLKNIKAHQYFYISTDSVYEDNLERKIETSPTKPLNYYALTKLEGEDKVRLYKKNHYIIRTNIFGIESNSKKSLFEWAYSELINNNEIPGYTNVFFNPLFVNHLSEALVCFLEMNIPFGTYNLGSNKKISKLNFIKTIATIFEISNNKIIDTNYVNNVNGARRPLNTYLDCSKAKSHLDKFDWNIEKGFKMLKSEILLK